MGEIATVFWTDGAQAVRLPDGWRLDGDAVQVRREGAAIVLEPVPGPWDWLQELVGPIDKNFLEAVEEDLPLPTDHRSDAFR